jgi:hypothetical protein
VSGALGGRGGGGPRGGGPAGGAGFKRGPGAAAGANLDIGPQVAGTVTVRDGRNWDDPDGGGRGVWAGAWGGTTTKNVDVRVPQL